MQTGTRSHIIICYLCDLVKVSPHKIRICRIPSGTDGWMDYVPISAKKNVTAAITQDLRDGDFYF